MTVTSFVFSLVSRFSMIGFRVLAGGFLVISVVLSPAGAQPTDPESVRNLIVESVARVTTEMQVLVDPRQISAMTQDAIIFTANFCYPSGDQTAIERCAQTIENPDVFDRIVETHLIDRLSGSPIIDSIAVHLARKLGYDLSVIGWPDEITNESAVVHIPDSERPYVFAIETSDGPLTLGSGADAILVSSGLINLTLSGQSGDRYSYHLDLTPRQRIDLPPRDLALEQVAAQDSVVVRIEPGLGNFCGNPIDEVATVRAGPLAAFNSGRSRIVETEAARRANITQVARSPLVDIAVNGFGEVVCSGIDCLNAVGTIFVEAIATWRSGCSRCDANAMSVIRVGDRVWLDWRIVNRLGLLSQGQLSHQDLNLSVPRETRELLLSGPPQFGGTYIVGYDEVPTGAALVDEVCNLPSNAAPWIAGAKEALCGERATISAESFQAGLTFLEGDTSCGNSRSYFACGIPGGGIEATLDDAVYEFRGPGGSYSVFAQNGDPALMMSFDLETVILHEVGHWFGVPHAEDAGDAGARDVMSEVYGDGQNCLAHQSMIMMQNASDIRWEYRMNDAMGFGRPQ
jgi:hypothetical protein